MGGADADGMGKTNRQISGALGISEKTVEKHIGKILEKLGVGSRVETAVWAVEMGLVEVGVS